MSSDFQSPDDGPSGEGQAPQARNEPYLAEFARPTGEPELVQAAVSDPQSQLVEAAHNQALDETLDQDDFIRLHPTSLVFDAISHGKSFLIPAVIGMFSAARGDAFGVIFAGVIFIPAILVSVFRYFTFKYSIQNKQLVVKKGLIFRQVRTIPVKRIQNIDFVQNLLHRMLQVAEVRIETASGTEAEATMRVLSLEQMELLRKEIFELQASTDLRLDVQADADAAVGNISGSPERYEAFADTPQSAVAGMASTAAPAIGSAAGSFQDATGVSRGQQAGVELLKIPLGWLVYAGLASNRGMVLVGIAMGAFVQFDDENQFRKVFEWLGGFLPDDMGSTGAILGIIAAVIAFLVALRLFGIGWFVLRFFGYKLKRHGEDLRISCGLFTKVSATVPRNRIQFISIHRNLIMRTLGFASVRLETAGGATNQGEDATASVSKKWFVPVIPDHRIPELLEELRPGLNWNEDSLDFKSLSPRAGARLTRLAVMMTIVVAGIGFAIHQGWGWLAGPICLPFFVLLALKKSKSMKYCRTADGIIYRSGIFYRKISMTFFDKVQALEVNQSPFDRRWKMAKLTIDTAAAGPAEHRIEIPYLDQQFLAEELRELRVRTARHEPSFA